MRWLIIFVILLSLTGCASSDNNDYSRMCIDLCKTARADGVNLSRGPCLANPIKNTDWVCDVAHNPREMVDNMPENQCSAFRDGTAHHFVEVDESCKIIRVV